MATHLHTDFLQCVHMFKETNQRSRLDLVLFLQPLNLFVVPKSPLIDFGCLVFVGRQPVQQCVDILAQSGDRVRHIKVRMQSIRVAPDFFQSPSGLKESVVNLVIV